MKKICKITYLFVLFFLFLILPKVVLADYPTQIPNDEGGFATVPQSEQALPTYIVNIYHAALPIAAALAALVIIYGGYRYITSAGNPEALKDAKDIIVGALIGLVLLLLAYVILNQLQYIPSGTTS